MLKRSIINQSIEIAKGHFCVPDCVCRNSHYGHAGTGKKLAQMRTKSAIACWAGMFDFCSGDFKNIGRTLFTLRNGRNNDPRYPKSYAEIIILDPERQRAPAHFHKGKREDIINRGSGFIVLELTKSDKEGEPAKGSLMVSIDGVGRTIPSGDRVKLKPGQSICKSGDRNE